MKSIFKFLFIIITGTMSLLFQAGCSDPGPLVYGGGTQTIGTLVDEKNQAAVNVSVNIFRNESQTAYDSTRTGFDGKYKFDSLPAGSYTITGQTSDGKKTVYIEPFTIISDSGRNLGTDTMHSPGSIQGCINFPGVANINHNVAVYIPGTSFSAWVNDTVPYTFTLSGVPKGTFTLKFTGSGFSRKTGGVVVRPDSTTTFDSCLTLDIDTVGNPPAPAIKAIASYDQTAGSVILSWYGVPVADLGFYEVYRFDSATASLMKAGQTQDTVFIDTVFGNPRTDTIPVNVTYQVKCVDKNNNPSTAYSGKLTLTVSPPKYYVTHFIWKIKSLGGSDTVTTRDSAAVIVTLTNRENRPLKCEFTVDNTPLVHDNLNASRGEDSLCRVSDTLICFFRSAGKYGIRAVCIDEAGNISYDSTTIDVFDTLNLMPHDEWVSLDTLSMARYYVSAAALDSVGYIIGGAREVLNLPANSYFNKPLSTVERYDLKTLKKMSDGVELPQGCYFSGAAVVDKTIYLIGGMSSAGVGKTIWSFTEGQTEWVRCKVELPCGLWGMSVCASGSSIYITGGSTDMNMTLSGDILRFDPALDKIEKIASFSIPRMYHQTLVKDGKLFVIGGIDEYQTDLASVEVCDLSTGVISAGAQLSSPRLLFSAALIENRIYISGGWKSYANISCHDDIQCYNLDRPEDGWIVKTVLDQALGGDAAIASNGRLFSFGGRTGDNRTLSGLNRAYVYYP